MAVTQHADGKGPRERTACPQHPRSQGEARAHSPPRAAAWAQPRCSAPTWCGTVPPWRSACTSHGRRPPRPWTGCRRTRPTAPRCSWGGGGDVTALRWGAGCGGGRWGRSLRCKHPTPARLEHSQLRGEDPVEHGLLQVRRPEDEDVPQHIEDEVAIRPGADEPGLQEGGPLLL